MKTKIFNLIIIDESGSMQSIKKEAIDSVNETIQTIRILCNIDNMSLRLGIGITLTLLTATYCYRTLKKGITDEA